MKKSNFLKWEKITDEFDIKQIYYLKSQFIDKRNLSTKLSK